MLGTSSRVTSVDFPLGPAQCPLRKAPTEGSVVPSLPLSGSLWVLSPGAGLGEGVRSVPGGPAWDPCADRVSVLQAAKLANYAKYQRLCDTLFVIFSAVFMVTRLGIYPSW